MEIRLYDLPTHDLGAIERTYETLSRQHELSVEQRDWLDWAEAALRSHNLKELGFIRFAA